MLLNCKEFKENLKTDSRRMEAFSKLVAIRSLSLKQKYSTNSVLNLSMRKAVEN